MNKKDYYRRKQYTARRGGHMRRKKTPFNLLRKERRKIMPKWAKWGELDIWQNQSVTPMLYETKPRRDGHEKEKDMSVLNKNFRRHLHPIRDKRKYWNKKRERAEL
jgi:hypothetical protein